MERVDLKYVDENTGRDVVGIEVNISELSDAEAVLVQAAVEGLCKDILRIKNIPITTDIETVV